MVFLCDFDPSQAWLRGSTGRKDPLSGVGQPPLPQFRLLGILRLKKERQGGPPGGSFLGRASFQRRGEKELLWEKGQDVRSVLAMRAILPPSLSKSVHFPPLPHSCTLVALLSLGLQDPLGCRAPATKPTAAGAILSASSLPRRCSPSASLLLSWPLFWGILSGVFFLGSRACTRTQARRHTGPRPPSSAYCSRLPAGRALAAGLAMPRLAAQSAALRERHTKAASPGLYPLGFCSSVLSPHPSPKKFWGPFHRVGDPWPSRQVDQRPKTGAGLFQRLGRLGERRAWLRLK
ncbi:uncharacterized protein [Symphalangus syndactylus]